MAYTMSTIVNTVFGNERLWAGYVTFDAAATSVVIPGAVYVDHVINLQGVTTASCGMVAIAVNAGPAGTAALGSVALTSVASAKYMMTVIYH